MRRRVFELIWQSHKAVTAAEIMGKLGNKQPPITYRALEFLVEHGFIRKVSTLNAYVGCLEPAKNMGQLLICSDCHNVIELKLPHSTSQMIHAADESGFRVNEMYVEILGQCNQCV